MPAVNRKESELDSEDGTTTRWRCVERWNDARLNTSGEWREFHGFLYRPEDRRRGIDAGRGDGWGIDATARNQRTLVLFLGTAIVCNGIPRQIAEAHQGWSSGDGEKDQRRCNPVFGSAQHIHLKDRLYCSVNAVILITLPRLHRSVDARNASF
jgi:hypothetical protein